MLSKPLLSVSGGRNEFTSTSMPSRSRTARAYSARFSRWNGRHPGLGFNAAALAIRDSNESTSARTAAASGCRAVGGGIMPARSFRIIFSAVSAFASIFAASKPARTSPPALPRSLWQPEQYCATSWFCASIEGPELSGPDLTCDVAILTGALAAPAGVWGAWAVAPTPRSPAAATATTTFLMIEKYMALEGGNQAFCRLPLSRIVMCRSRSSGGKRHVAHACFGGFMEFSAASRVLRGLALARRGRTDARAPATEAQRAPQVDPVPVLQIVRVHQIGHRRLADVVRQAPQPDGLWKRQLQHRPLVVIDPNPALRVEEIGCGHLNTPPLMREDARSACRWRVGATPGM